MNETEARLDRLERRVRGLVLGVGLALGVVLAFGVVLALGGIAAGGLPEGHALVLAEAQVAAIERDRAIEIGHVERNVVETLRLERRRARRGDAVRGPGGGDAARRCDGRPRCP